MTAPAPAACEWHYSIDGERSGPVSLAELQAFAAQDRLTPDDLVWTKGFPDWRRAGDLKELRFPPPVRRPAATPHRPAARTIIVQPPPKSPGLAAVLSFLFIGLGQIYNGEIGKAIAFMIVGMINVALFFVFCIGAVTGPVFLLWSIIDAYTSAERINREAMESY